MAGGASIVVDIKAQITGYQEQIEKIKQALKSIDPGSTMGKMLLKTLSQAEQKIAQLSRNAEKRITSQSQLDHLFDQLHTVHDLIRNLGQGMSNVGLDDVLSSASEHTRELGAELKTLKSDLSTKGASFFEELKKTNPKELQAVFDQLKFDPAKMGIDEFVEKFDAASKEVKEKIDEITQKQAEAEKEVQRAQELSQLRAQLPGQLQTSGRVTQKFLAADLNSGKFASQGQEQANAAAQNFLDQIRAGLEKDERDEKTTEKLDAIIASTADRLTKAKSESEVQAALVALNKAIIANTTKDETGKNIENLTGGISISEWTEKLTGKAQADQEFITKVQAIADILSKNESTASTGTTISEKLNSLVNPSDIGTFEQNMKELIKVMSEGLTKFNQETAKLDVEGKKKLAESLSQELTTLRGDAAQLENIKNNPQYEEFRNQINGIISRLQAVEQKLGLEIQNNRSGAAGGIQTTGKDVLTNLPQVNERATASLQHYSSMLEDVQQRQQMVGKIEGIAQRWFSIYAVVRMVSKAIRSMTENIKKLDTTITEIAIVTDMSQSDLWKQMPDYTKVARKYGASLQGVYEVSQLYYQQGLEQADVMALTEETLKMARISGLDYSEATNYMTNAVRSFKIEMQDASRVVDVYSALAATSASSTSELAKAMSKTASSAAAVGSSFEATSAMLAVMIETTRESPENIGSALKSIISRYGELKKAPTGIDEEGEAYSLNKVDTALQSVGISIHDAKGQFRDFDEVIQELADSWDTIDTNTQRYIATIMAGNRQQSRFLALVSNGERLKEETKIAENSEDAATLQFLKTVDSIDYKADQLQTSLQSLYTSTGIENLFKGILDIGNQVVKTFTEMPTLFSLPIPAIMTFGTTFITTANLVMTALRVLKQKFISQWKADESDLTNHQIKESGKRIATDTAENNTRISNKKASTQQQTKLTKNSKIGLALGAGGLILSSVAGTMQDKTTTQRATKGTLGTLGMAAQGAGLGLQLGGSWGAAAGAAIGLLSGLYSNLSYFWQSTADQAKRLKADAEEAQTVYKQKIASARSSEKELKNIKELEDNQYKSVEAHKEYIEAANKIASDIPELVSYYDTEGNAILDLSNAYAILAAKRREANAAATEASQKSIEAAEKTIQEKQEAVNSITNTILSRNLNDDNFTGIVKEKWTALDKQAPNFDFGHGQQLFNVKWGNASLRNVSGYADNEFFTNTPALASLRKLLETDDTKAISNILRNPNQRDASFKQWRTELESITDPFSKALMDFVLAQLEFSSAELTASLGELSDAEASYKSEIHAAAAESVNNFLNLKQIKAQFGESWDSDTEASKKIVELFEGLDNSSEVVTNHLEMIYNQGLNQTWKNWEEFQKVLDDPNNSPLLQFIQVLEQIPQTAYFEINKILGKRGQYTKSQLFTELNNIIQNTDLTKAIVESYNDYYSQILDSQQFYTEASKQSSRNNGDIYFNTARFDASKFSGEELSTMLDMTDKIYSMYQKGNIDRVSGRKFMNQYRDLWKNSTEAEQTILNNITDLSSTGLEELNTIIDNSDEFSSDEEKTNLKNKLVELFSNIPQNVNTALKTYEDKMVEATESYNKDIASATKGMDYKAASEMAETLNIKPISEYFDIRDGKMYLKDMSLLYEHYFGKSGVTTLLNDSLTKSSEALKNHITDIKGLKLENIDTWTQKDADKYDIDLTTLKAFLKDSEGKEITEEYIESYFSGKINNATQLVTDLLKSDELTRAIDSGKLKDIVKAGTKKDKFVEDYVSQVTEALKIGDFQWVNLNDNYTDEFKAKLPELKKTYNEAQSSVIDDIISGLNEDFTYIEGSNWNQELLKSLETAGLVNLTPAINGVSSAILTAGSEQVLAYLESITNASDIGLTTNELREKIASVRKDSYEKSADGVLQAILDNYDNIDEITYQNFMDKYQVSDNIFSNARGDGSRKTNIYNLISALNKNLDQYDELTQEKIKEVATKAIDDGMSSITDAANYVSKGTTKYQDMQDFVKMFNEAMPDANATVDSLFKYDSDAQAYVLDVNQYIEYLTNEAQLLHSLGENTDKINGLIDNANQSLIDAIDIKSFLDDENMNGADSKSLNLLKKQLTNAGFSEEDITDIVSKLVLGGSDAVSVLFKIADLQHKELTASDIESAYRSNISRVEEAFEQLAYGPGSLISGMASQILEEIDSANEYHIPVANTNTAVIIKTLDNISEVYLKYYEHLKETGVATLAALNEAYAKVLETQDNRNKEQAAIDALGDAAGMTYTAFGAILSEAGIEMTDDIVQMFTESMGGNKIRIKDFKAFADWMGWDFNSEEYISAFKSYNDGLIELNKKAEKDILDEIGQLENAKPGDWINLTDFENQLIQARKQQLENKAKESDDFNKSINIQEWAKSNATSDRIEGSLNYVLNRYGAFLEDGILHLEENSNLLGVAMTLRDAATKAGFEVTNELADMFENILKAYTDAIINGIKGGLSNVEAEDLRIKAKNLGLKNELSFTQTAEGLKLSERSAIELYNTLKSIDALQATLVFDELNNSLKETNENYKSIGSILTHIDELQKKINSEDSVVSKVRKQQYEEELKLAQEILSVRSTTEDDSFNFMSNKIPGAQNNPLNYYNNWAKAIHTVNDAMKHQGKYMKDGKVQKSGLIDYQDWYNMITEMNNLASESNQIEFAGEKLDGSLEAASRLIQKGADALVMTDTGEVKIALTKISTDFASGADVFSDGVTKGIQAYAKSQVTMLDGMIQLLEAIVAFEELGDIDLDGMGIDLTDLFTFTVDKDVNSGITDFTEGYSIWRNNIIKKIDEYLADPKNHPESKDLVSAFQNIKLNIDGNVFSLENMIRWDVSDFNENKGFRKAYTALVSSLVKAAQSGNYDLDNIAASVQQELASAGLFDQAITIDIGDSTLIFSGSSHAEIKWDDKDVKALVEKINKSGEDGKEVITTAMSKWTRGVTMGESELEYVLTIKKKIEINDENNTVTIIYNGESKTFEQDTEEAKAYIGATALEESGFSSDQIKIEKENGIATTTKTYTNNKEVNIIGDTTGIHYISDITGKDYGSEEQMYAAEYHEYLERKAWGKADSQKDYTYEQWLYLNYGIRATVKSTFTDENGNSIDINSDNDTRDAVKKILDTEILSKYKEFNSEGNVEIPLENDVTITLDGDLVVDSKGNVSAAKLKSELMKQLGIDQGLADTITLGITTAFTSMPDLIVDANTENAFTKINELKEEIERKTIKEVEVHNQDALDAIEEINRAASASVTKKVIIQEVKETEEGQATGNVGNNQETGGGGGGKPNMPTTKSIGTIGLAKAQGTLMGELGPELVVSNGRYFVAGQNGPEMVNLADDAIVFNHLQTKSLLEKGMSSGRGKAVTSERNAVAFATGNVNGGPAMASASAALAALKELRAQWDALAGLSTKDLAGKAGGGGGGGNDPKAFTKELERWYDWLQQIAQLEKEITLEEAKRTKYQNDMVARGKEYYTSQVESLKKLQEQAVAQRSLTDSQEAYFEKRRKELNEQSAFSALYGFSESGQLYYKDVYKNNKSAFEWLSDLVGRDARTGEANYTAKEQYDKLVAAGFGFAMQYDSSGNEIKKEGEDWYATALQAFWDKIDADKEEMQSLHDSVEDGKKKIIELENDQNEILHDIEDNQITVENKVLKAVEEVRQREIDELQKQRDTIEKSAKDMIDGLSNQLQKEQDMYQQQAEVDELNKLQRQLAIMQRTGGSAAQIADLQRQISDKQQSMYFDIQQKQIDALQEASDNQLERLDHQIEIMTETLEYQKEYGLLWNAVYEVLKGSPENISNFIKENTQDYWGQSPTELVKTIREDMFEIERFKQFQETVTGGMDALVAMYNEEAEKKRAEEEKSKNSGQSSGGSGSTSGGSGSGGNTNNKKNSPTKSGEKWVWKYNDSRHWEENTKTGEKRKIGTHDELNAGYYGSELYTKCSKCGRFMSPKSDGASRKTKTVDTPAAEKTAGAISKLAKRIAAGEMEDNVQRRHELYASGGMNYTTGLAMLHGTKTNPESVLNAEQTRILRNNILSHRPDSLVNLLKSYNEAYQGLSSSTYDSISNNSNLVTIEHAEVNLQVEKLANDYDSKRAANTIMDEMLRIASKTSANNSVRR